jgi:thiamine-phosphate pyrophosphorylase
VTIECTWRGFYAIVDPAHCAGPILDTADALLEAGCAVLQLRDKRGQDRDALQLAIALQAKCAAAGVPFVMNDRLDLALLVGADGLHLGQDDLPLSAVRPHFDGIIGVSTHDEDQAKAALRAGADLIGFGPVFPTDSKANPDPVVGLAKLELVASMADVPVVAIGGVTQERASECRRVGARLVAAISAVIGQEDVAAAAADFVSAMATH